MAARQKHRMAGKPYNLRRKVEIPVELQVQDDGAFLNEFSSQLTPGQSGSKSDTDIDSDIDTLVNGSSDSDHDSVTSKCRLDVRKSERAPHVERMSDPTSSDQALINAKISSQLDAIGKRLNVIESKSVQKSRSKVKKSVFKPVAASSNLTVPQGEAHLPENLPNLQTMRHDRFIQEQVENCLKELSGLNKKGIDSKIKSQRGGAVDVYVNQRVKCPHEFVLAGTSKDRLNYNQLNITQWMAGFCRIMRDEENLQTRGHMLDYLIALLDNSNDFSWQAVKASHAVLLCRMEQGVIASWAETDKINRIRRANAQRHTSGPLPTNGDQKLKKQGQTYQKCAKSMPCIYFNDNSCTFTKHHETKGVFYRHICSYCFAQDGKVSTHSTSDCKKSVKND